MNTFSGMRFACLAVLFIWAAPAAAGGPSPDPFEPDNSIATARPLSLNEDFRAHTLHVPQDEDWFRIYLVQQQGYEVRIEIGADLRAAALAAAPDACRITVDLFYGDGQPVLDNSNDPYHEEVECTDDEALHELTMDVVPGFDSTIPEGNYYLRVETLDGAAIGFPEYIQLAGSYEVKLACLCAPASGRLNGMVRTAMTLQPIVDANILIRTAADGVVRDSGFSDENGNFSFPPDAGDYQLRIFKDGFISRDWDTPATVVAGQTTTLMNPIELTPLLTAQPPDISNPLFVGTVGTTSAAVQAAVNPNGDITTARFEAIPAGAGTYRDVSDTVQTNETTGFVVFSGLSTCTDYTLQISATNSAGQDDPDAGEARTFKTAGCPVNPVIDATSVVPSQYGATLGATISTSNLTTTVRFEYDFAAGGDPRSTPDMQYNAATITPSAPTGTLSCNTAYRFRVVATNPSGGSATSADIPFSTTACPLPEISVSPATLITRTSARINGFVEPNGQSVTGAIEYRESGAMTWLTAGTFSLSSAQAVFADVSGLVCGRTYEIRISASGGAETKTGSFATSACTPPTIGTLSVPAQNFDSLTFQAMVNTNGLAMTLRFEYRVSGMGSFVPLPSMDLLATPAAQTTTSAASGLVCGTSYEFRVVATNVDGTTTSPASTGSTLSCSSLIYRDGFE